MFSYILTGMRVLWKHARSIWIARVLSAMLAALMAPLSLYLLQLAVDEIIRDQGRSAWLWILLICIILCQMVSVFSGTLAGYWNGCLKRRLERNWGRELLEGFGKIHYAAYEDAHVQDILSKMRKTPWRGLASLGDTVIQIGTVVVMLIGDMLLFAQVSWVLSVLLAVFMLCAGFFQMRSMKVMNDMFANRTADEREMEYYEELLSEKQSVLELKVFSALDYIRTLWHKSNERVLQSRVHTTFSALKYNIYSSVVIVIWILLLLWGLADRAGAGTITLGEFTALVGSIGTLLGALERASYLCSVIARRSLLMRYYEEFQALPRSEEEPDDRLDAVGDDGMMVEFQHVSFHYPGSEKEILKDCSFRIRKGEKVALVGENGAGKSTIVKLLCGLYAPVCGEVLLAGKRADSYTPEERRQILSVVFQDFGRYQMQLRENVAIGNLSQLQNDAAIRRVLTAVDPDFESWKLDQNLGKLERDGVDLSGGEWQKVAIARALVSNSQIILLDEPTASLDPMAESEMYHTFVTVLQQQSCLMISHRLASARMTDRIMLIQDGRIAEEGTHDQLLARQGAYAAMWEAQSQWYQEEVHGDENIIMG